MQWIDEQREEVPSPQNKEKIVEEIVDVPVPPVDALEAFQLQVFAMYNEIQEKYFDMFSKMKEWRMQLGDISKKIDALQVQESRIFGQVGDRVAESGGFAPRLFLNGRLGVLMEEKQGYAAAIDHLVSERHNILDYVKGLQEQREQLNQSLIQNSKMGPVDSTGRSSCTVEETCTLQVGMLFTISTVLVSFMVEEEEGLFRHWCSECHVHSVQPNQHWWRAFVCSCCLNVNPRRTRRLNSVKTTTDVMTARHRRLSPQ